MLVVANGASDVSRQIALYYQQARGIPAKNIFYLSCPATEIVSKDICENQIRRPIRDYLQKPSMAQIDYIVVTKGVPLAANYGDSTGVYSVTSILTCVDSSTTQGPTSNPYGPHSISGSVWAPGPDIYWSSRHSFLSRRTYCVTRLDAYTLEDVKRMIDGAVDATRNGVFLLDKRTGLIGYYYNIANNRLGPDIDSAYYYLIRNGASVILDETATFVSNAAGIIGYFGWGSNDPAYTYYRYMSNRFVPGSIADTYYSFSARTFTNPGTLIRGNLIADLFPAGLCGGSGYVSEPYLSASTFPDILFDRYTRGYNMAESFFAATNLLFWKSTVVGDPLMAPFATPPSVRLVGLETALTGTAAKLLAEASDASGIAKVDFYVDDVYVGTATNPPYEVVLDTTPFVVGTHTVEAIAYENSNVFTLGSTRVAVKIVNDVSNLTSVAQAFQCADGQRVRLSGKLVTAAKVTAAEGIYIEEPDRSAGICVRSTAQVSEGDAVDVEGALATLEGERVLVDATVTPSVRAAAATTDLRPLGMKNSALGGGPMGLLSPGVTGGQGLGNVGLLVRTWGRVVSTGECWFYIDDGSRRCPVSNQNGIKVYADCLPPLNAWVSVTGICGCEPAGTGLIPVVRTRRASDVVTYR